MNSSTGTQEEALRLSLETVDNVVQEVFKLPAPLRRSPRERNRISTSTLHRFRSLFWDGDERYSKPRNKKGKRDKSGNNNNNSIHDPATTTEQRIQELELVTVTTTTTSKKRTRQESEKDDPCVDQQEINGSLPSSSSSELSQSSVQTNDSDSSSEQQQQQKQQRRPPNQQRWWPKRLCLQKVHDSPHIYIIDNFLTLSQLEYLHHLIQQREQKIEGRHAGGDDGWQRSFCDTDQGTVVFDDEHRTSSFLGLPKQSDRIIRDIERTAADLLGVHSQQLEALQLVRYRPGEFFGLHHDLGELVVDDNEKDEHDKGQASSVLLPPKSIYGIPRRLATLFCYLNTLPAQSGGATYFPLCSELQVQPKAGRAVLFCNITPEGLPEPKTIHAGQPLLVSEEFPIADTLSSRMKQVNDARDTVYTSLIPKENSPPGCHEPVLEHQSRHVPQQQRLQKNDFSGLNMKYGLNIWVCEA